MDAEPIHKFSCPSCGQHLSTSPDEAGQEATCPTCSTEFVIPEAPSPNQHPIPVEKLVGASRMPFSPTLDIGPRCWFCTSTPPNSHWDGSEVILKFQKKKYQYDWEHEHTVDLMIPRCQSCARNHMDRVKKIGRKSLADALKYGTVPAVIVAMVLLVLMVFLGNPSTKEMLLPFGIGILTWIFILGFFQWKNDRNLESFPFPSETHKLSHIRQFPAFLALKKDGYSCMNQIED